ncbi:UNVERIFIED_CONTAM: hypothetical protein RMT77_009025 [Armadillidium vulgare]
MDEKLIQLVRDKPELYDMSDTRYSDNNHKNLLWEEIGNILNKTGAECKQRWMSLRSQHRKALQKYQQNLNGPTSNCIRRWKYEEAMKFLIVFMKEKSIIPFIKKEEDGDDVEDEDDEKNGESTNDGFEKSDNELDSIPRTWVQVTESTPPMAPKKKQKITETPVSSPIVKYPLEKSDAIKEQDALDMFLLSMSSTIKTFSPYDQHLVKTQIFDIVTRMEAKYLMPDSPTT